MVVIELDGGGTEPVSVNEAKAWCRIDRNDEDELVAALIGAARETVERETGVVLVRRSFRMTLDAVPADRRIRLPRRPLVAVTGVTAIGADGTPKGLAAAAVSTAPGKDALRLSLEAAIAGAGGIEIEFAAGLAAGTVPETLKLGIKRIVAASYELRGAVAPEMQPAIVPEAARALIAAFRERRL